MSSENSVINYPLYESEDDSVDENLLNLDEDVYFRNVSLAYFVAKPIKMLTQHAQFKALCLKHGNPQAHYIEGFIKYFMHKEERISLHHLRISAKGNFDKGTYLYGLLALAKGYYPKGKKYLDKLDWKLDISKTDHCWTVIKNSLLDIPRLMKSEYYVNMINIKPQGSCNPKNMVKLCDRCYYFKRLNQFVHFARNKD